MDRIKSYTEPPAAGRIYHTINQSTNSASIIRPFQPLCRFRAPSVISFTKEGIILSFLLPRGQLLYPTRNCQNDYPSPATPPQTPRLRRSSQLARANPNLLFSKRILSLPPSRNDFQIIPSRSTRAKLLVTKIRPLRFGISPQKTYGHRSLRTF